MPRFYNPPPWRHLITDQDGITLTFLDRLAAGVVVEYDLNTPSQLTGRVPSASPEINILAVAPDNDPFLAEGSRRCYSFRGDDSGAGGYGVYGVRHAGIVLGILDEGNPTTAYSTFTVLDPWAYLYSRPCVDNTGNLPGAAGLAFLATEVAEIALQLLENTISAHGPVGIDAGTSWGGTVFYNGFIAGSTEVIDYTVERGKTVGEIWEDLCATELIDIELVPIYDPFDRPTYLSEMNVYRQPGLVTQPRGEERPEAIFSWDRPPRTLAGIRRNLDGRQRANTINFYTSAGISAGTLIDTSSLAKYGEYWYEQQFPDQGNADRAQDWANAQLALRARGNREIVPIPDAQQPPLLWDEYFVGDYVPVYASERLRETIPDADAPDVYHRVVGLTLSLDPDEQVSELRVLPPTSITT